MRIVIDMQGAQTESRFRGIGRYTMDFVQALIRNRGHHEIILALSGLLPDSIAPIREAFADKLPQQNILVWYAPGPVKAKDQGNQLSFERASLLREDFLASLRPDIIHLTSLFEGYIDDGVTSIGLLGYHCHVSVVLFDLIPLINPEQYLNSSPAYTMFYRRKIEFLRKASLFLTISDFSRREGIKALSEREDKFVNISSAVDSFFKPLRISKSESAPILKTLGINRSFILTTGGFDDRKNLPRLIDAFAKLPEDIRSRHQLVFVGKTTLINEVQLLRHAHSAGLKRNELIITGYIDDSALLLLYRLCVIYVFPSWHEGFGLPALEAMSCGAPVIASSSSSLPEVIGLDDALFDPFDISAIAHKLAEALTDELFRQKLRTHSLEQANKFSWDLTVQLAIKAWSELPCIPDSRYPDHPLAERKLISELSRLLPDTNNATMATIAEAIALNQAAALQLS